MAVFEATLEDVSLMDVRAPVLGNIVIESVTSIPINFSIQYNGNDIKQRHRYNVRGKITVDGRLMFITDTAHPVLTGKDLFERKLPLHQLNLHITRHMFARHSLQPEIPVNSFAMATHGLGMDGLLHFYKNEGVSDTELTEAFIKQTKWPEIFSAPYVVKGSAKLAQQMGEGLIHGITITAPGFYGPQGRSLRLEPAYADLNDRISAFLYKDQRIINFEMETSALYALGKMLGHNTLTICTILANRMNETYSKNPKESILRLIKLVLERITA